jgi:hypothetical protein
MAENFTLMPDSGLDGYQRLTEARSARRRAQVASATALWSDLLGGRVPSYYLQEALSPRTPAMVRVLDSNYPGLIRITEAQTTSDFPYLTGDVLDRMMLAKYNGFPAGWRNFMKVATLRDFRTVRRLAVDGLEGQWDDVPEQSEIEYNALSETNYTYAPLKYAKATAISFEALMNDDLGAFTDIPERLGRGAARTIAKFATDLYVGANGPDATFYSSGNGNVVTSNPALSIAALGTAWSVLRSAVDADGEPIMVEAAWLEVPPALEVTAMNILNATQVWATNTGGASGQEIHVNNWIGGALKGVIVNPYIPIIATSSNGSTSWFLHGDPGIGRPAFEIGFLAGFQEPQMYQKLANTTRVGGGVDQMAGDFATMATEFKGVTAFGGTTLDPKASVASQGDGS